MTTVGSVVDFFNSLDPKSNLPRVSFYNYLRYAHNPMTEFSLDLVKEFVLRSSIHSYWQNHMPQLCEALFADLKNMQRPLNFDVRKILNLQDCQVLEIKSFDNYYDLLKKHEQKMFSGHSKLQFIQINEKDLMVIALFENEDIEIQVFLPRVYIQNGELTPLPAVTRLKYSSDLELIEDMDQMVAGEGSSTYLFTISSGVVHGYSLRLPSFSTEDVIAGRLQKNIKLMSTIKQLERYFIDPHSDPFYQSICKEIEDAQTNLDNPMDRSRAEQVLRRARLHYREIFPNDKLLLLLITNLEHKLNKKTGQNPWASTPAVLNPLSDSISSYQKAESPAGEKPTSL